MQSQTESHPTHHAHREIGARAVTAVGLLGVGLIHVLDSIGKYGETRYLFWMYIALILGSIVVSVAVVFSRSRLALLAAAGLAASALVGFVLSRTTGLPNAMDDVGNWTEPLGLASMFVEAAVMVVAGIGFAVAGRVPAAAPAATRAPSRRRVSQRASTSNA
ncbi:MAG: hypothetical protein ACXVFN_14300 [Solirubrobacteraceae bacterium]